MKPPNVEGLGLRLLEAEPQSGELVHPAPMNSIELHRNVKGAYSWTIKCYGEDPLYIVGLLGDTDRELRRDFLKETS